jgi:cobalt-zinc-cadmium efflux system outer membrane protein
MKPVRHLSTKSWKLVLLTALVCSLARTGTAQNPSGPLTLAQVIDAARSKNPSLLQAERNLQGVKAQEIQAGLRANPYFTFYGTNVTLPAEGASNPYAYSFQVSRLFERGDKRAWRIDAAKATTEQSAAQLKDQERQTILNVKQAFTNMLIAKAALQLAQENLGDFKKQLDINRERYQAGDIGKLDFERLDLQRAQFETDESTAEVNLAQASDQLQTLMGYDRPSRTFDIAGETMPPTLGANLADLEQRALASRPDLQAAEAGVRAADANVKLAYANGTTDPTLEGEFDRSGTYNSAGFSINIPLRIFDRNQGNKLTNKFQAQASRFAVTAARNQAVSDVDQAWAQYTTSKVVSDRYNGHYLGEAKDVLAIAEFAYQQGGLALIDYLNAVQDNRTTSLNALNAYSQTRMAIHQLSFATGTELLP